MHSAWKPSTFFDTKSKELFLLKRNKLCMHIENTTVSLRRQIHSVPFMQG